MSFAFNAKRELCNVPVTRDCCARAELAGLMGTTVEGSVFIETEHPAVARRAFMLLKRAGMRAPLLRTCMHRRLGRHLSYRLSADEIEMKVTHETYSRECCRRAFLRGAFLAGGTIGDPEKGYHMEWRTPERSFSERIKKAASRYAPTARITKRRDVYVYYCKDSDQIADLLSALGAVEALLKLENIRVLKGVRNQVNRIVNCESANVDKTTNAAQKQIASINFLESRGKLHILSAELIEAAELRVTNPEATLEELGELFQKPIGKSGVNHRMRRLITLARSIQDMEEESQW